MRTKTSQIAIPMALNLKMLGIQAITMDIREACRFKEARTHNLITLVSNLKPQTLNLEPTTLYYGSPTAATG